MSSANITKARVLMLNALVTESNKTDRQGSDTELGDMIRRQAQLLAEAWGLEAEPIEGLYR